MGHLGPGWNGLTIPSYRQCEGVQHSESFYEHRPEETQFSCVRTRWPNRIQNTQYFLEYFIMQLFSQLIFLLEYTGFFYPVESVLTNLSCKCWSHRGLELVAVFQMVRSAIHLNEIRHQLTGIFQIFQISIRLKNSIFGWIISGEINACCFS